MSKQTKNLGLFQYDPQEDGAQTFNIDVALNENWDKIDDAMERKADLDEGGKIPANQLPDMDVSGAINAHNIDAEAHPDIRRQVSANAKAAATAQSTAESALREITKINNTIHVVPTQNGTLTYNGSAQSPAWNSYNPDIMTLGGVTSGTDVGTYTATFTPKDGYFWEDGGTDAKSVTWVIVKATVSLPTQNGTLTYNGSAQSPTWNNYDAAKLTIGGTTSGTNAGTYNATFTPTSNYQWNDGTVGAKTVTWVIAKAMITLPTQSNTLTYNGNAQSPTWNNYDTAKLTINGTTSGKNAGSYNVSFTPTKNYQWNDGTTGAKTATWIINKAALKVPRAGGYLTYKGSNYSLAPAWYDYDDTKMTRGGDIQATYPGNYATTFTIKDRDNYQWSDGTTGLRSIGWTIYKGSQTISLSKSSVSLHIGNIVDGSCYVTHTGNGALALKHEGVTYSNSPCNLTDPDGNVVATAEIMNSDYIDVRLTDGFYTANFQILNLTISVVALATSYYNQAEAKLQISISRV